MSYGENLPITIMTSQRPRSRLHSQGPPTQRLPRHYLLPRRQAMAGHPDSPVLI